MSPLAPPDGGRALFWACALASFLAVAATLGAAAAQAGLAVSTRSVGAAMTVRVVEPANPGVVARAEEVLTAMPEIASAAAVTPARAAALAKRYGADLPMEDLVGLRLIEVQAAPGAPRGLPATIERRMADAGFVVEAAAAVGAAQDRRMEAERLSALALGLAALTALVAALSVGLMARARAAARREAIALLAELGATRGQAENAYGGEAAFSAFAAATLGAAAAAALIWITAPRLAFGLSGGDLLALTGPADLAPIALAPVAAALVAAAGARAAAGAAYDRTVRR